MAPCSRMSKRCDFNLQNSETRGILILTFFLSLSAEREVEDAVSETSRPKGVISVGPVILGKSEE